MEGEQDNVRTRTNLAIARAREALRGNTQGNNPNDSPGGRGSSEGDRSGKGAGVEVVSGSPNNAIDSNSGSEGPRGGIQAGLARTRLHERRASLRDNGNGKTREGTQGENRSGQTGDGTPANHETGNPATETETEDQNVLEFPPEAYFSDGRLKKSWAEKLKGNKKTPDAKPSSLVKKKGLSYLGDKELFNQVAEGIQYFFKTLDLGATFGLGVEGVWELDENEAAIFARILLKRADKGDKKAIKTIATISENMDMLQAAMIVIPRVGVTIKEVKENGIKPKNPLKRGGKSAQESPGINTPGSN